MLCACIRRALMLTWRNYHLLYPLMVILLKKYGSAVSTYCFYFYCYVFGDIFFILITTKIKNLFLVNQFLASEATEAGSIFDNLQSTLSTQQGELALFARELRNVCASKFSFILSVYYSF